jgi:hypothetical protein
LEMRLRLLLSVYSHRIMLMKKMVVKSAKANMIPLQTIAFFVLLTDLFRNSYVLVLGSGSGKQTHS